MIWKTVRHGTTEILIGHLSAQKKKTRMKEKGRKKTSAQHPFQYNKHFHSIARTKYFLAYVFKKFSSKTIISQNDPVYKVSQFTSLISTLIVNRFAPLPVVFFISPAFTEFLLVYYVLFITCDITLFYGPLFERLINRDRISTSGMSIQSL